MSGFVVVCLLSMGAMPGSAEAQVYTNGVGTTAGAPPTPSPRQPPSPQVGIVTNTDFLTNNIPSPSPTNRLFPPATNSDTSGNLHGGDWFYPAASAKFYRRGTNAFYQRGTNGFFRVGPNGKVVEYVPDRSEVYRPDAAGVYHHYILRNGVYIVDPATDGATHSIPVR